jgi:hypothetical protein
MVTDREIEEIISRGEAGVGDVMEAYERAESAYFSTFPQASPIVTYYAAGTTTSS